MKITAFDTLYPATLSGAGSVLDYSSGSNTASGDVSGGGDVVGSPGDSSVVGLRSQVSLASNIGGGSVGDVLTILQASPRLAAFATSSNSGSGFDPGWYIVTDAAYGAVGDGTTDDTTAVQAAIDACMTAGGGTVYFPAGIYQISGALQNTGTHNSQLVIPTAASQKSIRFLGAAPNKIYGGTPSTGSESVIRSDWDGAISGNPAIISAGTYRGIGESVLYATFQDLTIVAPDDPKLSALQMTAAQSTRIQNVQIRTTSAAPTSLPTHSNAVGLDGPWGLGSIVPDYAIGFDVYGFYTGIVPAEQFHGVDVGVAFCTRAVLLVGGQGSPTYTHYPVTFTKLVVTLCPRALVFTTDVRWVNIASFSVEHDTGTFASVYDIDDASNYAYGFISYHVVDYSAGVGVAYALLVNGAGNLSTHWGTGKVWKLNSVVEIPTGTDPSTNPATGGRLYAASATGYPTWRDSAGTVTNLLSSGTPATTVESETTLGIAAAVGTDTEYARQDHTHGSASAAVIQAAGFRGELLVADGTVGPTNNRTEYVEMTTARTTTSASLEDITGVTADIELQQTAHIAVWMTCHVSASAVCDLDLAINFDGTDEDATTVHLTTTDEGNVTLVHRTSTEMPPGTYTVKGRFARSSGGGTPEVDRADFLVMSMGASGPVMLLAEDQTDYIYGDLA